MPDEFKTLLKIEGDATEAKRAVTETKTATEQLNRTTNQLTDASIKSEQTRATASEKTAQALEEKSKKTEKAKTAFSKLAESMGTSESAARAFKEALSRISPELGGMLDIGMKFEQVMSFGLSKIGLMVGAAAVGITAVAFAWSKVQEAIQRAEEAAKRFGETQARIQEAAARRQGTAVRGAAAAGLPPAATGKVRELTRRLTEQGISPETAEAVAPYFVDEAGEQVVSDEEATAIAAAQQFEFIQPMTGAGRKRDVALRRARRYMSRSETAALARNAVENLRAELAARAEARVISPAGSDLRDWVAEQTGLEGEELEARVGTIARQLREGVRTRPDEGIIGYGGPVMDVKLRSGAVARETARRFGRVAVEKEDPLVPILRRQSQRSTPSAVTTQPAATQPATTQPAAGVTYLFNHGIQVFGKDTRDEQIPRVNNP